MTSAKYQNKFPGEWLISPEFRDWFLKKINILIFLDKPNACRFRWQILIIKRAIIRKDTFIVDYRVSRTVIKENFVFVEIMWTKEF